MKISERRQQWKNNHITALESLGFIGSFRTLRKLENRSRWFAEKYCNGEISEYEYDKEHAKLIDSVRKLFKDQIMPRGFFINGDPRGYALKIESNNLPDGLHYDWGHYGILAPDFNEIK